METVTDIPKHLYKLTDEERLALVEIVRYGDIDKIPLTFRDKLLCNLAEAVVLTLYGQDQRPIPDDVEEEEMPESAPSNCDVIVQFIKSQQLPTPAVNDQQCNN